MNALRMHTSRLGRGGAWPAAPAIADTHSRLSAPQARLRTYTMIGRPSGLRDGRSSAHQRGPGQEAGVVADAQAVVAGRETLVVTVRRDPQVLGRERGAARVLRGWVRVHGRVAAGHELPGDRRACVVGRSISLATRPPSVRCDSLRPRIGRSFLPCAPTRHTLQHTLGPSEAQEQRVHAAGKLRNCRRRRAPSQGAAARRRGGAAAAHRWSAGASAGS